MRLFLRLVLKALLLEGDQCAMATYDHHSDLARSIADPAFRSPRMPIDSRIAAVPEKEKEQRPVSSHLQATIEDGRLFQDALLESGGKSRPRNPWAAVGSLAVQLLLLLALIVVPLFHTDPLPKRETLTMLYLQPPPAAAGNARKLRASTPLSPTVYTRTSTSIPAPVHKTQEAPPPPVGTSGGVVGGVTGGVVGGVPGGMLSEVLRSTGSAPVLAKTPASTKRIRVPALIAEANLVYDVAPKYPPEAGRARIEGTVVLLAVIGKDGTVQDVRVESGLSLLAQAAIAAVKQWRYKPYMIDGEPFEVDSRITINFTLSES